MADNNTERLWRQLLALIEEGCVIPVIGPELLMLGIDGEMKLLYSYLAEQLANRLQISAEPDDTLNAIACRYLAQGGQRDDIYPELKLAMPPLSKVNLPEALVKLAEIQPFNLFVTTSFDPLLAHALNQVRYGGQDETQVLAFSPGSNNDLPAAQESLNKSTVFHLFGKLTAAPDCYVVTDEDVLEFMYALQSRTSRPERLFDILVKQNLMVIGCPLCDWLGRFFVRIIKKERLVVSSGKTDYLAGDQLQNDTSLAAFLQHFSCRTKVFPMASIEFVNELHRRWKEKPSPDPKKHPPPPPEIPKGAVFLSYASKDRPAVILIRDALEQVGIDVWFDRNREDLRSGDDFEARIKSNIERCSVFIPIISRNTLTGGPRFFRIEWNYAQEMSLRFPDDWRFIIPVVIDDTPPDESAVPKKFRKLHWESIQDGRIHEAFVNEIKGLYRDYQRTLSQPI
jgi:hypothetical protein